MKRGAALRIVASDTFEVDERSVFAAQQAACEGPAVDGLARQRKEMARGVGDFLCERRGAAAYGRQERHFVTVGDLG